MTTVGLAIGVFDGVHVGHQALLKQAAQGVDELIAVTFDPHPAEVFAPDTAPPRLTLIERRSELLRTAGADRVHVLAFGRAMASWSPEEFVHRIIVDELRADVVTVGENFRFGHRASGTTETLQSLGREHHVDVRVAPLATDGDEPVSSTRIRLAIAAHDLAGVTTLLGTPFALTGVVVRGASRGHALGFPTANMRVDPRMAVPPDGIYAGHATTHDGTRALAAISVGTNPTFGDNPRTVEPHLLDFEADLYGHELTITFERHIRGQQAFDSVDELVAQIASDVDDVRNAMQS